jgi:flagellar L-ring protein precursor FlgH
MPAENTSTGSMFADHKATKIGDIITVLIVETATVSQKASSSRERDSNIKGEVKDWSMPRLDKYSLNLNPDITTRVSNPDSLPKWEIDTANKFSGGGTFSGNYTIRGQITTRIVEVLANKNLVLEGTSEVLINKEKNTIAVSGIVRPEDVSTNNTVMSTQLADAKVQIVGKGPLNDKTNRGLLEKLLDFVWPF